MLSSREVRLHPSPSVGCPKHASKTGCFRETFVLFSFVSVLHIFSHHRVSTGPVHQLICTPVRLPCDFCVCANNFCPSTGKAPSLHKECSHLYGKLQCIFVRSMRSCLISMCFCCLLGIPEVSWKENLGYFGCGLIADGLGFLGGVLNLMSYMSSGIRPFSG